jgi:hypothetical protein
MTVVISLGQLRRLWPVIDGIGAREGEKFRILESARISKGDLDLERMILT